MFLKFLVAGCYRSSHPCVQMVGCKDDWKFESCVEIQQYYLLRVFHRGYGAWLGLNASRLTLLLFVNNWTKRYRFLQISHWRLLGSSRRAWSLAGEQRKVTMTQWKQSLCLLSSPVLRNTSGVSCSPLASSRRSCAGISIGHNMSLYFLSFTAQLVEAFFLFLLLHCFLFP